MSKCKECWICGSADVVYVDVIDCGWCEKHFQEYYLDDSD